MEGASLQQSKGPKEGHILGIWACPQVCHGDNHMGFHTQTHLCNAESSLTSAFRLIVMMRRTSSQEPPGLSLHSCCLCCAAHCLQDVCSILFQHHRCWPHHFSFMKKHGNFSSATHKPFRIATPLSQCTQSSLSSAGTVNPFTPAK